MTEYCLDCCSLINLFCGWGGIQEFHRLGNRWSISATAFSEFTHVRIEAADGSLISTPVDHADALRQYPLRVLTIGSAAEQSTLMRLNAQLDDGEAASLTLAHHRGMTFVTDDAPAIRAAQALGVPTVSTAQLLMAWEALDPQHLSRMPRIIGRIGRLASFIPATRDPHRAWWDRYRVP